jgi:hypothetical protein
MEVASLELMEPDLVSELLQANRTSLSLQEYRDKAKSHEYPWTLGEDGLLKHRKQLVVAKDQNIHTRLITEAHTQKSTAHPGKNKMCRIISDQYYWPGMTTDIDRYVRNCNDCRQSTIPQDKAPGLLKPLPIPERPWQHISMDFHKLPKDRNGYNNVVIFVDRFGKRTITVPYHKAVSASDTAKLYIRYVYPYFGPLLTIISD